MFFAPRPFSVRIRPVKTFLFVSVLPLFFVPGCGRPQIVQPPPRPVRAEPVIQKDVPNYFDTFGSLKGLEEVSIKSQVTGRITEARFQQGQLVKKGDILFVIDKAPFRAALDKARAQLKQNEADYKLKQYIVEKDRKLYETKAISEQKYAELVTDLNLAGARVETDKADIEMAEINLGYCDIVSPVSGVTGKRLVDAGNVIEANSGPALVNVKEIDKLYIDFTIPEKYLFLLRNSMRQGKLSVFITPERTDIDDAPPTLVGVLEMLDNAVDYATGAISLRAKIDNDKMELWPGQFVKVRLVFGTLKNALLAPSGAVQVGKKGEYLFRVRDGKAEHMTVKSGLPHDSHVVVEKSELAPGDLVVTVGQMGLVPGCQVRVVPGPANNRTDAGGDNGGDAK